MPLYDYRCDVHGDFELKQRVADHAEGECPTCGQVCRQVITRAPGLDIEAMSKIGMPGAWETVGDRITRRHKAVSQSHRSVLGDEDDD